MKISKCTLLLAFCLASCNGIRVETILIPYRLTSGGVLIEQENPRCPPSETGLMSREFRINEAGYACTSSKFDNPFTYWRYYRVEASGKLTKLEVGKDVFAPGSLGHTEGGRCNVKAEIFLYGHISRGPIPRDYSEILHEHHPECPDVFLASGE